MRAGHDGGREGEGELSARRDPRGPHAWFAQIIRDEMDRQRITQGDMADMLGVTQARISQVLTGRVGNVTLMTMERMAAALECDLVIGLHRNEKGRRIAPPAPFMPCQQDQKRTPTPPIT